MTRPVMGDEAIAEELWAAYQAIQLTPDEKAAAYRRAQERAAQASRDGVYERAREIAGTVKWSFTWQTLRAEE